MKGLATEHRGIIHRHRQQYSYEQKDGERGSAWGRIGGVDVDICNVNNKKMELLHYVLIIMDFYMFQSKLFYKNVYKLSKNSFNWNVLI